MKRRTEVRKAIKMTLNLIALINLKIEKGSYLFQHLRNRDKQAGRVLSKLYQY